MTSSGRREIPREKKRFVIFAHARSGSTSLVRVLERHPEIRILNEPFNEEFTRWRPGDRNYRDLVTDTHAMDRELSHIFADFEGVKLIGYQMPRELYAHVLRDPGRRMIYVRRANLLQSVVSVLIAEQTHVWHAWDLDRPIEDVYANLRPLDVDDIRKRVRDLRDEMVFFADVVSSRPVEDTLTLLYEDLYLGTTDDRRRIVDRAFAFLGFEPIEDAELDALIDPARTKLNDASLYRYLPNAEEIDDLLSNAETGCLFGGSLGDESTGTPVT